MQHLVFVYGTLRKGESNHHFIEQSEYLGMCETLPEYALYDLGATCSCSWPKLYSR